MQNMFKQHSYLAVAF